MKVQSSIILSFVLDHQLNNNWSFLSVSIGLFSAQMRLSKAWVIVRVWNELDDHIKVRLGYREKTCIYILMMAFWITGL